MKTNYLYAALLLAGLTACKKEVTTEITTDTKKDTVTTEASANEKPMDSAAMMKAWMDYATPGDMQKMLASDSGMWTEEVTMWMSPGAKPDTSKMTADIKMSLGGRYQESKHTGTVMGQPFEGKGVMAYNNASGTFSQTWMDNMATGIMYMEGKYDTGTKTITFTGDCVDPMTKKPKKIKQTFAFVDDNTRKMESFDTAPDGKEYKSMEIVMTREK